MFKVIDNYMLDKYLQHDWVKSEIQVEQEKLRFAGLTGDRWMLDSSPKRMVYAAIYGDLFQHDDRRKKVLDVGGGFCSLSPRLVQAQDYDLVDICSHESADQVSKIEAIIGDSRMHKVDWHAYFKNIRGHHYDIVIANDLFPNVDQRLELFLKSALPHAKTLRMSLTFYDQPRFYQVKRVDADEILWYLAWNQSILEATLRPFADRIIDGRMQPIRPAESSLYPNGRHLLLLELKGDLF